MKKLTTLNSRAALNPLYGVYATVFALAVFFGFAADCLAEPREVKLSKETTPMPKEVENGFNYLFEMIHNRGAEFDASQVADMVDFVAGCDEDPRDMEPKRRGGRGIALRMDLDCGLDRVVKYLYNPDIPNYVIVPSVLRLSGWEPGSDILNMKGNLWDRLGDLSKPVVLWGKEYESNTPDSFAGAYYRYDMFRLVVLMEHNGKKVLISVTEQDGDSDVGKKGAILDDQNWVYFYSGIEGLDRGLISWMDTYMYSSYSVQVYVENEPGKTRDVLFKWLKAGWSGLNVVMRKHFYEGALRFSESLKTVLESDVLPPSEELGAMIRNIEALPDEEVDRKIQSYAKTFELMNGNAEAFEKKSFAKILKDGGYANVLNREERIGILVMQKLKSILGKPAYVDMSGSELADALNSETVTTAEPVAAEVPVDSAQAEESEVRKGG